MFALPVFAGEAGVPFFHASGSEFDEVFVGTGAKRVRQLFSECRPCCWCCRLCWCCFVAVIWAFLFVCFYLFLDVAVIAGVGGLGRVICAVKTCWQCVLYVLTVHWSLVDTALHADNTSVTWGIHSLRVDSTPFACWRCIPFKLTTFLVCCWGILTRWIHSLQVDSMCTARWQRTFPYIPYMLTCSLV